MVVSATRYRELVEAHGLSATHRQIIEWVPSGSRVLDVGCASGYVGKILIEAKGCAVTGIEADADAAEEARSCGLSVVEGSLDDARFRASLPGGHDVVIAADVLEHLRDPRVAVATLRRCIRPGGMCILAVPNVATWHVRAQLFFSGRFEYEDTGIMDRTHVHFFTWNTFHRLVREQGFVVEATMTEGEEVPLLGTLLFDLPQRAIDRLSASGDDREKDLARTARLATVGAARRIRTFGNGFAEQLARIAPNLCAGHVAVLLRPQGAFT
jgi:methionine biosynthesis protein MetW